MNLSIRPMTPTERNYSYTQGQEVMAKASCIGHLRADFGSDGEGFYSSWDDHTPALKTDDFKAELNQVINALRFDSAYDGILASRGKMAAYCYGHPESSYGNDREFGFRADTERYAYLLRLNPNRGEYNLYAYCYVREWLDRHLEKAAKGIQFITPEYKELFRIPDGDNIRVITSEGKVLDNPCRFIDETHVEIGGILHPQVLHICQFAELTQHAGSKVIPLRSSLPEKCFACDPDTGETVVITKGADGWESTGQHPPEGMTGQEGADLLNEQSGVTRAQAAAMLAGATQGWASRSADPASYDTQGNPVTAL
ncbi:MAG: hypothetical protein HDT20_08065 [Oscillibacter sp.]|nr:hypothetical protein [Oscillibacter sp.]